MTDDTTSEEKPQNEISLDPISDEEQECLRRCLEFLTSNKKAREELA